MLSFRGNTYLTTGTVCLILVNLISIFIYKEISQLLPDVAFYFMLFWLLFALSFSIVSYRNFACGFLLAIFGFLISWRISAIYSIESLEILFCLTFLLMLSNFLYCILMNLSNPNGCMHPVPFSGWQLSFIRIYVGLDFIPHFTEKLFAGSEPYLKDVNAFADLGVPHPFILVFLAGLCEFCASISLTTGLMTRTGAIGATLYLIIATYLGNHFSSGFIWVNHGGGWEFAVMWMVLVCSYAFTNARDFSLDQCINDRFIIPDMLKIMM